MRVGLILARQLDDAVALVEHRLGVGERHRQIVAFGQPDVGIEDLRLGRISRRQIGLPVEAEGVVLMSSAQTEARMKA